ncbi:MAG: glycosyltransferase family 2 protein [Promethearchaeota archaeon]
MVDYIAKNEDNKVNFIKKNVEIKQKKNEPLVSIIIISFNDAEYLMNLIPSIKENTNYKNYEIIIIDNGNQKDLRTTGIKKLLDFCPYKIIRNEKNIGFGRANNVGLRYAQGKYLLLLNSDVKVFKNWVSPLVKVMEQRNDVGICGGQVVPLAWYNKDFIPRTSIHIIERSRVIGAYLMYRRELAERFGLFDPLFFLYGEDTDLCYRIILKGYKVVEILDVFILHGRYLGDKKVIEIRQNFQFKFKILTFSDLYLIYKYFGIKYFPIYMILQMGVILKSFLKRNTKSTVSGILHGYLDFLIKFKYAYRNKQNLYNGIDKHLRNLRIKKIKELNQMRIINIFKHIDSTSKNYHLSGGRGGLKIGVFYTIK